MPVITIKIAKGRPVEKKRELVKEITKTVAGILDVKEEWVTVLIDEYERDNWATGGELHSDKFGPGHGASGTGQQDK
jgi:4-oxalocrotonate tautomerase